MIFANNQSGSQFLTPGADTARDVLRVESQLVPITFSGITVGTQLVSGPCVVGNLRALGGTLGAITIYDGTSTSGVLVIPAFTPIQGQVILEDVVFNTGVFIVQVAATIIAGGYR